MTISSEDRKAGPFTGNDATVSFPFEFKVFAKTDLQVVWTDADSVEHELVLDSEYSVTLNADQDDDPGGTIAYPISGAPLAAGEYLTLLGNISFEQPTDITNAGGFYPQVIENALDRQVILTQQLKEQADRSLRLPVSAPDGTSTQLPLPAASTVIGWDPLGARLVNYEAQVGTPLIDLTATTGAALVGANDAASGSLFTTVAGFITRLMSSAGAALVGFIQTGVGAVMRAVQSKLRDNVSALDFMTDAQRADVLAGTALLDVSAAIQSAITAAGSVHLPAGAYQVTADSVLKSNLHIYGDGDATIIKIAADNVSAFTTGVTADKTNITIRDLLIDGGGQTGDIYTGFKRAKGIYASRVTKLRIDNVSVRKCGVVKSIGDPTDDNLYGGYGLLIEARHGAINDVRVNGCRVTQIAGGGDVSGDGIMIGGFSAAGGASDMDVVVSNCWVSTVGRHAYTVSGESPESIPSGVKFINCYGEKSALDGIDVEEGYGVKVRDCTLKLCGNDQTYYNPLVIYGAAYRLMAGIAVGNASNKVTLSGNDLDGCYYGITYGAGANLTLESNTVENSTVSDLVRLLATGGVNFKLRGNNFLTTGKNTLDYFLDAAGLGFSAIGNTFASVVRVSGMSDGVFKGNTFKAGFTVYGGSGAFRRNKFLGNSFGDFAGTAVTCNTSNYNHPDNVFHGNTFYGAGNLVNGFSFGFSSVLRWQISGNKFIGLTGAGISQSNGNAVKSFNAIGNDFISCVNGIDVVQSINNCVIADNTFTGITGWCIGITAILTGAAALRRTNITGNVADDTCANGLRITLSGGNWDYCILANNNFNGPTGTKWALPAGNANGFTANNITT